MSCAWNRKFEITKMKPWSTLNFFHVCKIPSRIIARVTQQDTRHHCSRDPANMWNSLKLHSEERIEMILPLYWLPPSWFPGLVRHNNHIISDIIWMSRTQSKTCYIVKSVSKRNTKKTNLAATRYSTYRVYMVLNGIGHLRSILPCLNFVSRISGLYIQIFLALTKYNRRASGIILLNDDWTAESDLSNDMLQLNLSRKYSEASCKISRCS